MRIASEIKLDHGIVEMARRVGADLTKSRPCPSASANRTRNPVWEYFYHPQGELSSTTLFVHMEQDKNVNNNVYLQM